MKKIYIYFFWTVSPVFEQKKKIVFVKSWKNFSVFAREKEFVIKLLKILKWVNCSVQAIASLGVARRLLEMKKKSALRKVFLGFYSM